MSYSFYGISLYPTKNSAVFFSDLLLLTPENHKAVIDSMFDTFYDQNDLIGIQPEPCLTPFFTGNLLHEIFNYDLLQADAIPCGSRAGFSDEYG